MSELSFEQLLEESFKTIHTGEVVDGKVLEHHFGDAARMHGQLGVFEEVRARRLLASSVRQRKPAGVVNVVGGRVKLQQRLRDTFAVGAVASAHRAEELLHFIEGEKDGLWRIDEAVFKPLARADVRDH